MEEGQFIYQRPFKLVFFDLSVSVVRKGMRYKSENCPLNSCIYKNLKYLTKVFQRMIPYPKNSQLLQKNSFRTTEHLRSVA